MQCLHARIQIPVRAPRVAAMRGKLLALGMPCTSNTMHNGRAALYRSNHTRRSAPCKMKRARTSAP